MGGGVRISVAVVGVDEECNRRIAEYISHLGSFAHTGTSATPDMSDDKGNGMLANVVFCLHEFTNTKDLEAYLSNHTLDIVVEVVNDIPTSWWDLLSDIFPQGTSVKIIRVMHVEKTLTYETTFECGHALTLTGENRFEKLRAAIAQAVEKVLRQVDLPILVFFRGSVRVVHPSDIKYLESTRRILHIHTDEVIDVYSTIAQFGRLLPGRFFQCHKSFLVNPDYVKGIDDGFLELNDGQKLPISQRRRSYVRRCLSGYFRGA